MFQIKNNELVIRKATSINEFIEEVECFKQSIKKNSDKPIIFTKIIE